MNQGGMAATAPKSWRTAREAAVLLDEAGVARLDAEAIANGASSFALMKAAGEGVAREALKRFGWRDGPVAVLAGPGKNGGDGYVAAAALRSAGRAVTVYALGEPVAGDAASAAAAWRGAGGAVEAFPEKAQDDPRLIEEPAFIVDALFGVGLSRPLTGAPAALARRLALRQRVPIVSVDLPSGLESHSGRIWGDAFHADLTVTFERGRIAHAIGDGLEMSGDIVIVPIVAAAGGTPVATPPEVFAIRPEVFARRFGAKPLTGHKYSSGHVAVASGGFTASGAARLAAQGALRSGAGLATVFAPGTALAECAAQLTAIMLRRTDTAGEWAEATLDGRIRASVLGPALSRGEGASAARTREMVSASYSAPSFLAKERTLVLDADALACWQGRPEGFFAGLGEGYAVMTPHLGEFGGLFPDLMAPLVVPAPNVNGGPAPASKVAAVRAAAKRAGAVVVLKGADTVIASPTGEVGVHTAVGQRAAPQLATAGSGDVLCGIIAGLAAQGWAPFEAACMGVWVHVEAARLFGPGAIAEDLAAMLPAVMRQQMGMPPNNTA